MSWTSVREFDWIRSSGWRRAGGPWPHHLPEGPQARSPWRGYRWPHKQLFHNIISMILPRLEARWAATHSGGLNQSFAWRISKYGSTKRNCTFVININVFFFPFFTCLTPSVWTRVYVLYMIFSIISMNLCVYVLVHTDKVFTRQICLFMYIHDRWEG